MGLRAVPGLKTVVATIGIAGPAFRMRRAVPDPIEPVTDAAARLSGCLRYSSEAELMASSARFRPVHRAARAENYK